MGDEVVQMKKELMREETEKSLLHYQVTIKCIPRWLSLIRAYLMGMKLNIQHKDKTGTHNFPNFFFLYILLKTPNSENNERS